MFRHKSVITFSFRIDRAKLGMTGIAARASSHFANFQLGRVYFHFGDRAYR